MVVNPASLGAIGSVVYRGAQFLKHNIGFAMPGWNVGKTIQKFGFGMEKLAPRFHALRGIKAGIYSGKGIFAEPIRSQMHTLAKSLPVEKQKLMYDWLERSGTGSVMSKQTRQYGDKIGSVFYKGIVHDMKENRMTQLINSSFDQLGVGTSSATGRFYGAVESARTSAYKVAISAHSTESLLRGPSLASNLAVIMLPTLASATTTAAVIRAVKRKGEHAYEGYNGNVF